MLRRIAGLALSLALLGCSDESPCTGPECAAAATDASTRTDGAPPREQKDDAPSVSAERACASQSIRAERRKRAVDAIFIIDNSGSMSDEIAAVRASINQHFAQLIDKSGVDLRVIMISRYGVDGAFVCVEPPLAGAPCREGLASTDGDRFFHYDLEIGSNDALCHLLASYDRPDQSERAPGGWRSLLRPESHKAFVLVTDDSPRCAFSDGGRELTFGVGPSPEEDALRFHQTLIKKASDQLGTPPDTRYQFFSIVGIREGRTAGEPLLPHQPLESSICDTAVGPGLLYQALSVATDALRYPVCEGRSFDRVFEVLARNVVESSPADCTFEVPRTSASGEPIDPATVNLVYRAAGGAATQLKQVRSREACGDQRRIFVDWRERRIELCPTVCTEIKRDPSPQVDVYYGCEPFLH